MVVQGCFVLHALNTEPKCFRRLSSGLLHVSRGEGQELKRESMAPAGEHPRPTPQMECACCSDVLPGGGGGREGAQRR